MTFSSDVSIEIGLATSFALRISGKKVTNFNLALLNNVPKVVAALIRHGTFLYEGDKNYPDLTPLYLAVASPFCCTTDYEGPL